MVDDPLKVYISLTAYGADEVRRLGQLHFARIALAAGADGVEVRSELLADADNELPALAALVSEAGKAVVYSSAEPMWRAARVDALSLRDDEAGTGGSAPMAREVAGSGSDGAAAPDADSTAATDAFSVLDLDALERALTRGLALGAERVKMSIGACHTVEESSLRQLAERLAHHGMPLTVENDQTESAGTYVALKRFFTAAEGAGLDLPMTFDIGNWHYAGECPMAMAGTFAWRANYVHCKGVQRLPDKWVAVPLTASVAPWRTILHDMPTNVPWAIEYPLTGADLEQVTAGEIASLRAIARHQRGLRSDFLEG